MSAKLLNGADLNGQRLTGLGTPTASTDAVTKAYADGLGGGGSSTTANGVEHLRLPAVGEYTAHGASTMGTANPANGSLALGPLWLPAGTYDAVAVRIDAGGSTGATLKVVGYWDSTSSPGRPGTLAVDTTAISATASGAMTITGLSLVVPAGGQLMWVGAVAQGAPTTMPALWQVTRSADQMLYTSGYLGILYANVATGYSVSGVTGAAPTSPTFTFGDQYTRIAFRRSA